MRSAEAEPFPAIMVDSKEEGKVCRSNYSRLLHHTLCLIALGSSITEPAQENQENMAERAVQEVRTRGEGGNYCVPAFIPVLFSSCRLKMHNVGQKT